MRYLFFILIILLCFKNNSIAQNPSSFKRFPVPDNFIAYDIFPKLNHLLGYIFITNKDYPYFVISKLSCEEVNGYIQKEKNLIKKTSCKFYRFYRISIAYCDKCEENEEAELMNLLSHTNRFIKVDPDHWIPVIFYTDYDKDFYLSKFHNGDTGTSSSFMDSYFPDQSIIIAINGSTLKIIKGP